MVTTGKEKEGAAEDLAIKRQLQEIISSIQ